MPTDPEHRWIPEPTSPFTFPADHEVDLLKDFCRQRYNRSLCEEDLAWLSNFVGDYFSWSRDHAPKNELRIAALRCLRLLCAVDEAMSSSKDPERTWGEISLALGLPSVCFSHMTGAELASAHGVTPMAVSKRVTRFLRIVQLEPAFGHHGHQHLNFH